MGALNGFRVVELAGVGPCPMAGMLLADMGAQVICVDRGLQTDPLFARDMSRRGKKSIVLDLKRARGRELVLELAASADALIEGFRPGVMEKLGLGPEVCLERNPKLVYGRMTGWGQEGPLAASAGHDINYIGLAGALHAIGRRGAPPVAPLNLLGDFGGGALFLVSGVLAALLEASRSGKGQVVDAAMVDGVSNLMWMCHSLHAVGAWDFSGRERNLLDGAAFFYDSYETRDGGYMALGAIEPQFFERFAEIAGLDADTFNVAAQQDRARWPELKARLAEVFRSRTRAEWSALFEASDACCTPVLSAEEALAHPHSVAREAYIEVDGYPQPAPAPRLSRTPSAVAHGRGPPGSDTRAVLAGLGYDTAEIDALCAEEIAAEADSGP